MHPEQLRYCRGVKIRGGTVLDANGRADNSSIICHLPFTIYCSPFAICHLPCLAARLADRRPDSSSSPAFKHFRYASLRGPRAPPSGARSCTNSSSRYQQIGKLPLQGSGSSGFGGFVVGFWVAASPTGRLLLLARPDPFFDDNSILDPSLSDRSA
jgi:hypothetical protein